MYEQKRNWPWVRCRPVEDALQHNAIRRAQCDLLD